MADTKIVSLVLGGLLLWAVLLVVSYAENESDTPTVALALQTAGDNNQTSVKPE